MGFLDKPASTGQVDSAESATNLGIGLILMALDWHWPGWFFVALSLMGLLCRIAIVILEKANSTKESRP